jgi:hypothetical protein
MRCPECNYFFSEEKRRCPKCGNDMGTVIEKLGVFPQTKKEAFLSVEQFVEPSNPSSIPEINLSPEQAPERKEIEIPLEIEKE